MHSSIRHIYSVSMWIVFLLLFFSSRGYAQEASKPSITILTAKSTGLYYRAGLVLERLCNHLDKDETNTAICSVRITQGTVDNINQLKKEKSQEETLIGLVQSDLLLQNQHEKDECTLQRLFTLYPESVHLLLRDQDSSLKEILIKRQKKGENLRIHAGPKDSGSLKNATHLLKYLFKKEFDPNWIITPKSDSKRLSRIDLLNQLKNNELDAIILTIGTPSGLIYEATEEGQGIKLAELEMDPNFFIDHPYYQPRRIKSQYYPKGTQDKDIMTFGGNVEVVTCKNSNKSQIHFFVKTIFENLDKFYLQATLKDLNESTLILGPAPQNKSAVSVQHKFPFHDGVKEYFNKRSKLYDLSQQLNLDNAHSERKLLFCVKPSEKMSLAPSKFLISMLEKELKEKFGQKFSTDCTKKSSSKQSDITLAGSIDATNEKIVVDLTLNNSSTTKELGNLTTEKVIKEIINFDQYNQFTDDLITKIESEFKSSIHNQQ